LSDPEVIAIRIIDSKLRHSVKGEFVWNEQAIAAQLPY
jgi:hypothetical protein